MSSRRRHLIGPYVVVERLGSGSFANVYHCYHKDRTHEHVAIKSINREKINLNKKHQENLEQEIAVMRRLKSKHIVRFLDILKTERHIYLVLELCNQGDLSRFIRRNGPLRLPIARYFLKQLAEGLRTLRSMDLVHRDLKPQNLLLTIDENGSKPKPTLKIADFGFARVIEPASLAATLCGSPLYMAPEILNYQPYDSKADLYSVGAILYEMVTGRVPFNGSDRADLVANITHRELEFPAHLEGTESDGGLDPVCKDLIVKLLQKDPDRRIGFDEFFAHPFLRGARSSKHLAQQKHEQQQQQQQQQQQHHQQQQQVDVVELDEQVGGGDDDDDLDGSRAEAQMDADDAEAVAKDAVFSPFIGSQDESLGAPAFDLDADEDFEEEDADNGMANTAVLSRTTQSVEQIPLPTFGLELSDDDMSLSDSTEPLGATALLEKQSTPKNPNSRAVSSPPPDKPSVNPFKRDMSPVGAQPSPLQRRFDRSQPPQPYQHALVQANADSGSGSGSGTNSYVFVGMDSSPSSPLTLSDARGAVASPQPEPPVQAEPEPQEARVVGMQYATHAEALEDLQNRQYRAKLAVRLAQDLHSTNHSESALVVFVKALEFFRACIDSAVQFLDSQHGRGEAAVVEQITGIVSSCEKHSASVIERLQSLQRFVNEHDSAFKANLGPCAEKLLYDWGLELAKTGAVAELLGKHKSALKKYRRAVEVLEQLKSDASPGDRATLERYVRAFRARQEGLSSGKS